MTALERALISQKDRVHNSRIKMYATKVNSKERRELFNKYLIELDVLDKIRWDK